MASIRHRQRKDGTPIWNVRYTIDGRESSASFLTEAKALAFKAVAESLGPHRAMEVFDVPDMVRAAKRGMTVADWLDEYISGLTGKERKTIAEYRRFAERDIIPVIGEVPLAALDEGDVSRWINSLEGAGKTIANKHGFLSSAIKTAARRGLIESNPCRGLPLPRTEKREPVFLTRDEYHGLYDCFSVHYKPLVDFLVSSGARFSEVTALRPGDVDRREHTVRIAKAWKKTDKDWELGAPKTDMSIRTIDMPAGVLDALDYSHAWLFTSTIPYGPRRGTATDTPVRVYSWRANVWYPALKKAQAKGLTKSPRIHDLRHTCASWMIKDKVPLPVIQRHLGHESIETTIGVYGHLDRDSSRSAAAAISAVLSERRGSSTV